VQVGIMDLELKLWTRPEDMMQVRPTFVVSPQAPGADLMGHTAAALVVASAALSSAHTAASDGQLAAAALEAAEQLYLLAAANEGLYSDNFVPNSQVGASSPNRLDNRCFPHCL
jgi:hypothetical protein